MIRLIKTCLNITLFDYWKWKGIGIGIACAIFLFAFILPNSIHNGYLNRQAYEISITNESGSYTAIPIETQEFFQNPFDYNWVVYGFLWLGYEVAGILALSILIFLLMLIPEGIHKLYDWSHDNISDK